MKKLIFTLLALVVATATLQSCLNSEDESHGISVVTRNGLGFVEMYADQVTDTAMVFSYDSWQATVLQDVLSETPSPTAPVWYSVTPTTETVPAGYLSSKSVAILSQPNNTGKNRVGGIKFSTSYANNGTIGLTVRQYAWLNITTPAPVLSSNDIRTATATFAVDLLPTARETLFECTVYGQASLTSNADWLTVPAASATMRPGYNRVVLALEPNESAEARTAVVTLLSNGVRSVVTVKQLGKK